MTTQPTLPNGNDIESSTEANTGENTHRDTQQTAHLRPPPDHNQYGMRDEDARAVDIYGNRPGGESRGVGPQDAVDSAGHRIGAVEERPAQKPSSRAGQAVIGEVDDKKR